MEGKPEIDWYKRCKYELNQDLKSGGITQEEYTAELLELNQERRQELAATNSLPEPKPAVMDKQPERTSYHGVAVAKRRHAQRLRRGTFFIRNALSRVGPIGRRRYRRA